MMNHADPKFIKLIDIIQATPMARINREDARHIAERLVESGVIREDVLAINPSVGELAKQIYAFSGSDSLVVKTVEARAKEYLKPVRVEEQPLDMQPVKGIPWDIDNNRPYEEWEIMLIDGRGPEWDVFRDSYPTSLQKAILAQGKGHPNHPEHDHTDCCK